MPPASASAASQALQRAQGPACTMRELVVYFLRLGSLGFGGPIALAGAMQRDLVDGRRWVSRQDYVEGLALAQLAPGPLAAQLAIYLGWVRGGVVGASLVGVAFVLPSFLIVLALSALYLRYGGLPGMREVSYGIGGAVIAIMAQSAAKLARSTLGSARLPWLLFLASASVTAWTEAEIVWVFLLSGLLAMLVQAPPSLGPAGRALALVGWPSALWAGVHGPADPTTLWRLFWYFAEAGSFVFGSGLAIVPFLHGGVVERFGWLDDRQFLDAVAVAMITPGPVVITVAFIGYLAAGPAGSVVATLATFLPCYLLTVIPAPYYRRFARNRQIKAFVQGVTAAATGAIAGATLVLGRRALVDWGSVAICAVALGLVRAVPQPLIILAAGALGLLLGAPGGP